MNRTRTWIHDALVVLGALGLFLIFLATTRFTLTSAFPEMFLVFPLVFVFLRLSNIAFARRALPSTHATSDRDTEE